MRNIHDERFIWDLTSSLNFESRKLVEMSDLLSEVLAKGSDRRDIFDTDRLADLVEDSGDIDLESLLYEVFNDYHEFVGDDEYVYVVEQLQFNDDVFVIRGEVYLNGDLIESDFIQEDKLSSFTVDHVAAYLNDLSKGLAR